MAEALELSVPQPEVPLLLEELVEACQKLHHLQFLLQQGVLEIEQANDLVLVKRSVIATQVHQSRSAVLEAVGLRCGTAGRFLSP